MVTDGFECWASEDLLKWDKMPCSQGYATTVVPGLYAAIAIIFAEMVGGASALGAVGIISPPILGPGGRSGTPSPASKSPSPLLFGAFSQIRRTLSGRLVGPEDSASSEAASIYGFPTFAAFLICQYAALFLLSRFSAPSSGADSTLTADSTLSAEDREVLAPVQDESSPVYRAAMALSESVALESTTLHFCVAQRSGCTGAVDFQSLTCKQAMTRLVCGPRVDFGVDAHDFGFCARQN